jgi:ABC-type bacteriocin/lantibiotic exporter with double-glycine peptidase domain
LVEPGVKYFLNQTLKQCGVIKNNVYNYLFNISLFILFLLILGGLLLYKYKGKLTPAQIYEKNKQKQQYILSKIKNYETTKKIQREELITGLPSWQNEFM